MEENGKKGERQSEMGEENLSNRVRGGQMDRKEIMRYDRHWSYKLPETIGAIIRYYLWQTLTILCEPGMVDV